MKKTIFYITALLAISSCKEEILPEVTVDFSASQEKILEGNTITFKDLSTGNPTSWEWSFEGGTPSTSTEQNPTITYSQTGVYSVTLTASNGQKSGTKSVSGFVTVFAEVSANFTAVDSVVNEGESIVFTDNSIGSPTSWNWVFEGGTPSSSTSQNPSVIYSQPGLYSVTLTAANELSSDEITKSRFAVIIPTNGLIAYFPFDGSAADLSGNNLNGTVYDAALSLDRNGNQNQAYYFNGTSSRIEVPNSTILEPQTFSISAFVNLEQSTGAIVSLSSFNPVFNNCGYYFSIVNGNLRGFYSIGKPNWAQSVSTEIVPLNQWVHVTTTFDGQNLICYIDGTEVSRTSTSVAINYNEHNPMNIGTYSKAGGGTWFGGTIDNLRIYNRALTSAEIEVLTME